MHLLRRDMLGCKAWRTSLQCCGAWMKQTSDDFDLEIPGFAELT
jgi:hypothetical protein